MLIVRGRGFVACSVGVAALATLGVSEAPLLHGVAFVIRAADEHGIARRAANLEVQPVQDFLVGIPRGEAAPLRARVFKPAHSSRAALVVSGLHPAGIDEPRLMGLARELSASGVTVVTPDIPELSRFEITPAITDAIERSAQWLADESTLAVDHRVGLMGVSFSGGLSIVAAGRPSISDRVEYIFAFGAHDDLPRVLRYLCTGVDGDVTRAPHDYGVAIILLAVADRLVPPDQVEPLRAAVRRFLWASHLARTDKPAAIHEFAALRELAQSLPEPSRTLLTYVNDRDVAGLGPWLLPYISAYGTDAALSPSRSPRPSAPVYLLHGMDDNVIPAIESTRLAENLRGHAPVRLLLSPLISHAEADQAGNVMDIVRLGSFWGELLRR